MTTTIQSQKRLGLILLALGFINEEQLAQLQDENAKSAGEKYGETAIRMGFVTSGQVVAVLDVQVLQGRLGAILAALGYVTKEQCDSLIAENLRQGEKIGDAAIRTGLISIGQLTKALCVQQVIQRRLGQILVALGFISEEQHTVVVEANLLRQGEKFGETAVAMKLVSEEQIINSVEVQQLDGRLGSILVALGDITKKNRDVIITANKQRKGEKFGETALRLGFVNTRQLNRAVNVQRRLQIETLEGRQMMSVNPLGVDDIGSTDEIQSAPAAYADQTPGATDDSAEKIALLVNIPGPEVLGDDDDHADGDHDDHDHDEFPIYDENIASQLGTENAGTANQSFETALTPTSFDLSNAFNLHSKADSHFTIYIDFTGYTCTDSYWTSLNGGKDIVVPAWSLDSDHSSFSDAELQQIYNIWQRVAEDYAPFDVDVTTEKPSADRLVRSSSQDTDYGIHVIVDDNSTHWYGNAGGVAGLGTFTSSTDRVAWVFADQLQNQEKAMAEAVTHEVGHTLGLSHDGTGSTSYYQGANGWAPIMGTAYYQAVSQWSKGEYSGANNTEDDLAVINKKLAYRADDHGDTFGTATKIDTASGTLKSFGIIEKNTDVDVFQFTLDKAWTLDINIKSGMRDANLDIMAKLCAADGTVIAISNSIDSMDAAFKLNLGPGNYYITIEGTGKVLANGTVVYSDYGSLGNYAILGTLKQDTVSPPVAPGNFAVSERTDRTVSLSWAQQSSVSGYTLQYRPAGSNAGWTTVAIAANANSVKVSGLDAKTNYEFQLTATNAGGSATSTLTAVTNAAAPTAPVLNVADKTTSAVTLNWNAQNDVASYILQYRAAGSNEWITAASPSGNAVGATISGLEDGTTYEFQLTAVNVSGSAAAAISVATEVDTTAAEAEVAAARAALETAAAAAVKEAQEAAAAQAEAAAKQALANDAANTANVAASTAADKTIAADNAAKTAGDAALAADNAANVLTAAETAAAKEAAEASAAKAVAEQAALNKAAAEKAVADAQAAVAAAQTTAPTTKDLALLKAAVTAAEKVAGPANAALLAANKAVSEASANGVSKKDLALLKAAVTAAEKAAAPANGLLVAARATLAAAQESTAALSAAKAALAKAQSELTAADALQQTADRAAAKEAAEAQAAQTEADAARQLALAFANESIAAAERSTAASAAAAAARDAAESAASAAQTAMSEASAALAEAAIQVAEASAAQEAAQVAEKALADAVAALQALRG